ncbi:hypothetical protein BJ138DRAFT_1150446 [Hygrophoropsis aurantiaca]|uniref:Uncharacterized protein n=1 Tax=Hygrophoropsis aurantiaca TaxID=72124 RepID=A0ACB8AEC9_9AGAM|nr:hypothetical protein BJ138DRAFT_1150446 [Hygrophoropsis aurantiaca]
MDPSEIGRLGTLRLMKRTEPNTTVATFPIDDEIVTFGQDPKCSVRLYYPSVSAVHAKIIFQDRKAFIVVLGDNGLLIDGCQVLPSANHSLPTTVPMSNNSEIEIHKKRFIFSYPPKELRTALYMSPSKDIAMTPKTRRKALRMSMIQSAEVFTPRPSKNPRENLKILQSPLKPRSRSPVKHPLYQVHDAVKEESEDDEQEIILVDGNHPHVMEEGKDLVILESVEVEDEPDSVQAPIKSHTLSDQVLQYQQKNPAARLQTPRKRPHLRPSLHRAVLIRSAQRAVLKQEADREEEEEEKEVEEFIADAEEVDEDEYEYEQDEVDQENDESEEHSTDEEEENHETPQQQQSSTWRKSVEVVKGFAWPFRSSSVTKELDEPKEEDQEPQLDEFEELPPSSDFDRDDNELAGPSSGSTMHARPLGQFMTPQVPRVIGIGRGAGRNSVDGTIGNGPRRVRVDPKWKVTDIVVPIPSNQSETAPEVTHSTTKLEEDEYDSGRRLTQRISDEERKAIQERRRSALRTPDPYFGGQVPGLGVRRFSNIAAASPAPASLSVRKSVSPSKTHLNLSPSKMEDLREEEQSGSEEEEDTRSLLARMKQTVEEMKRRRSVGPSRDNDEDGNSEKDEDEHEAASHDGSDKENGGAVDSDRENPDISSDIDDAKNEIQVLKPDEKLASNPAPQTPHLETLKHLFPAPKAGVNTPAVRGMRDLFKQSKGVTMTSTPRMDGLRDMYLREGKRAPDTPAFEGMEEMLTAPDGYEGMNDIGREEEPGPSELIIPANKVAHSKPRSIIDDGKLRSTAAQNELGRPNIGVQQEDAGRTRGTSSNAAQGNKNADNGARPRARLLRGRKGAAAPEVEDHEHVPHPSQIASEPKLTRSRIKTEQETTNLLEVAPKLRPSTRSRTTPVPSAATTSRAARSEPSKVDRKSRLPARQTLRSQDRTVGSSEVRAPQNIPVRRGRLPEANADVDGESESAEPPRASTKGKSRAKPVIEIIEDDDDDPLDSIGQPDDPEPIRTVKARKGKQAIKEEEDNSAPAIRAKRVTPAPSKAPSGASRARAASVKKPVPASTKLVSKTVSGESSGSGTNKENTPSVDDEEPAGQPIVAGTAKPTKAKKTTTAATKSIDAGKDTEVPTKTRITRATRARG